MLFAIQIFRTTNLSIGDLNYGKATRLQNRTLTYINQLTSRMLKWVCVHEGHDYKGKWAIIDELRTSTIQAIAEAVSDHGQHGPSPNTVWMVLGSNGEFKVDSSVTVNDVIGVAIIRIPDHCD